MAGKQLSDDGLTRLSYKDKEVPHEEGNDVGFEQLTSYDEGNMTILGMQKSREQILDGFQDAPGLKLRGNQIVGRLDGRNGKPHVTPEKPRNAQEWKERNFPENLRCQGNCGSLLKWVGKNRLRCTGCSMEYNFNPEG